MASVTVTGTPDLLDRLTDALGAEPDFRLIAPAGARPARGVVEHAPAFIVRLRVQARTSRAGPASGEEQQRHAVMAETCFAANAGVTPAMPATIAIHPFRRPLSPVPSGVTRGDPLHGFVTEATLAAVMQSREVG